MFTYRFKIVDGSEVLPTATLPLSEMRSAKCPSSSSKMNGHLDKKDLVKGRHLWIKERDCVAVVYLSDRKEDWGIASPLIGKRASLQHLIY